jgi:hypothetical protein
MAAARSTQAHVRQPPRRPSSYLATEDPVATGDLNVGHHQIGRLFVLAETKGLQSQAVEISGCHIGMALLRLIIEA